MARGCEHNLKKRCEVCKKIAHAVHNANWRAKNRETIHEKAKAYYRENREELLKKQRNRDVSPERAEAKRRYAKAAYHADVEASRRKERERYWADPEKARAKTRQWRISNPERVREQTSRSNMKFAEGQTIEEMLEQQLGKCALCCVEILGAKKYHVDHDHSTGKVRQLLCGQCNLGLGAFKENPQVFYAAIAYLEKHRQSE